MTDFSGENRAAPNGPAPLSRADGAHVVYGEGTAVGQPGAPQGQPGQAGQTGQPAPGPPPSSPQGGPPLGDQANGTPQRPAVVKGRIDVADEVVEKIAALAAIEVDGVADLGGDIARALESVRERIGIGQKRGDQGVKADIQGRDVAINITIVIEYGHVVMEVARNVQANVAIQTHRMLGLRVVEVNVNVDDVEMPQPPPRHEDYDEVGDLVPLEG